MPEETKSKRRMGDRKDGKLLRDLDSMHFIVPLIYPNRCDNEAYIMVKTDLTNINAYLEKKNAKLTEGKSPDEKVFKYTLFHILVAAVIKTITLRPKMNRFIANKNIYQRDDVTASFVVKKEFSDEGGEALAILHAKDEDTLEAIHEKIFKQVSSCRGNAVDRSTDSMDILNKMPRFLAKFLVWIITKLDKHGKCPNFLIATDPYYSSVILTNLGSIRLKCGYHHLTNWGTNSVFVVVGEKKLSPYFDENGGVTMRQTLEMGLTIDERIADGYYYSKTIRLLKTLLENPELLELPMNEKVEY